MNAPIPQSKTYEFKTEGIVYAITLKLESGNIIIVIAKDEDIPRKRFETKISYEELTKISKMFLVFESMEEIIGEFNAIFQANKFKLNEDKEKIFLYMSFSLNERKTNDICLEIKQCDTQQSDIMVDISHSVNQMKNILLTFGDKLNHLEEEMNRMKEKKKKRIKLLNYEFQDTLEAAISKGKIRFELLYKATIHGDTVKAFHTYCDNKFPTLVIIKTTKDIVFGGYTVLPWDQSGSYKTDLKAFIFSNTFKAIYPVKEDSTYPIYCHSGYGPTFGGGHDIYIANNFLTSNENYVNGNSYVGHTGYELNNKVKNFTVKELEIYQQINE